MLIEKTMVSPINTIAKACEGVLEQTIRDDDPRDKVYGLGALALSLTGRVEI